MTNQDKPQNKSVREPVMKNISKANFFNSRKKNAINP